MTTFHSYAELRQTLRCKTTAADTTYIIYMNSHGKNGSRNIGFQYLE